MELFLLLLFISTIILALIYTAIVDIKNELKNMNRNIKANDEDTD